MVTHTLPSLTLSLSLSQAQLQCSSPLAAQIFSLLVSLVLQHYDEDCFLPTAGVIRLNVCVYVVCVCVCVYPLYSI